MTSEAIKTLADICSDVSYGFTESANKQQVGPKFLRITDIQGGTIDWDSIPFCPATKQDEKKYSLEVGDIVIARTGNSTGENAQIISPPPLAVFASYLIRFRPDVKMINPFFVGYQLRTERFRNYVLSVRGGSAQPGANARQLGAFPIQIIERKYQDNIVKMLQAVDNRIALLRDTNSKLEKIAQALFKSWFVDFDPVCANLDSSKINGLENVTAELFPNSFVQSELGPIPLGWKTGTLADLTSFQNGYAFKGQDWADSGHPVIKIGNVKPRLISYGGCSYVSQKTVEGLDRFKLHRGDLLVGMTGYVGETGLVSEVNPAAYLNQRVGRFSTSQGLLNIGFVYCLVRSHLFKVFAESQSHGSAQANVSGADLLKLPVVIPTSSLLSSFNLIVHPIIDAIILNYEKEQTLKSLRDTLLPRLISGQIKLPDAQEQTEVATA